MRQIQVFQLVKAYIAVAPFHCHWRLVPSRRNEGQLAYYDSGVGTLADPTKLTAKGRWVSKKLDMAIGQSVRENVCEAYQFLCRNFQPGDKVFLFGFSRGAYTVRALAGMIHFLGLARPELEGLSRLAWAIFANDDGSLPVSKRFAGGNRFKASFAQKPDVRIHFVGVWDTVSSFGFIWNLRSVPFSSNNPSIDHVRHAVSIDEHRACFQANLFRPDPPDQHASFKQLWFPGAHADVGGGYPEEESGLAKTALEWMFDEAGQQGCLFEQDQVDKFLGRAPGGRKVSTPDVMGIAHNSTQGSWHFLEWIPRKQWDHDSNPERLRWFLPNVYRRRKIPDNAEFHESVRQKWDNDPQYRPKNLPPSFNGDR